VTAAELAEWIGGTVEEVETFVAMGVLKRESGLYPLWPSIQAAIGFWEAANDMGGPVQGEA
jgi:hypothetical protein